MKFDATSVTSARLSAKPENWFTSMFSGAAGTQDSIKSSPLNITKITAIGGVVATVITSLSKPLFGTNGPLSKLDPGQELILWLGVMGLVTVVVVVDVVVRAHVTARVSAAEESAPIVWFNPTRRATSPASGGDPGGSVVALRPSGEDSSGIQYLVLRDPPSGSHPSAARESAWVGASMLVLQ